MNFLELQFLWLVGSLERLATMGILKPDLPFQVAPDFIDDFLYADEHRQQLFEDDVALLSLFNLYVQNECTEIPQQEDLDKIFQILLVYKNDREKLLVPALNSMIQ